MVSSQIGRQRKTFLGQISLEMERHPQGDLLKYEPPVIFNCSSLSSEVSGLFLREIAGKSITANLICTMKYEEVFCLW